MSPRCAQAVAPEARLFPAAPPAADPTGRARGDRRNATESLDVVLKQPMEDLAVALATDLDGAYPGLVDHMGARIYWGLRRMHNNHQEAEDLAQETFIRAYRALCGYDRKRIKELKVEAWLWTIALNIGRNHLRDRSRRPVYVELGEPGVTHDAEMVDSAAWDRRLARLTRNQRTAVVLRHVVGLGVAEISQATGRPEGTVKADIHRGLARLKTVIEEEE